MARRSTHRLLDEAKRARAIADLRKNFSHVRDEREQQTGADETKRQAAVTTAKAAAAAPRTNALQTAARAQLTPNVNRQAGNPREGQRFATRAAKGGVRHVYANGTSIFVRKPRSFGASPALQQSNRSSAADTRRKLLQQVADQRRRKKGVKRTPMVG